MTEPKPLVRWAVPYGYAGGPAGSETAVGMYRAEDVEAAVKHMEDQIREAVDQKLRRPSTIHEFVDRLALAVRDLEVMVHLAEPHRDTKEMIIINVVDKIEDIEDHRTRESQRPDPTLPAWWISWWSEGPFTLHTPWWTSGSRDRDGSDQLSYVGAVRARDVDHAFEIIEAAHDDPTVKVERRFCEPLKDPSEMPVNDLGKAQKPNAEKPWTYKSGRFPKADWMVWSA